MKSGPKNIKNETIRKIRVLYENGLITQQQLAHKFDLSQSTICKIVNNYIHKNTPNLGIGGQAEVQTKYKYGN